MLVRPLGVFASLVLVLAPAAAQSTVPEAVKQARTASKAALAEHKTRTAAALVELKASLAALVAGLQADQFGAPLMQGFLDSAQEFQLEVADATEDAELAIADAYSLAVTGLAESQAASFEGAFPAGFVAGDGGSFDDQIAALRKAVAKLYAKVRKAGEGAVAKAKAAGVGLALQFFEPPRRGFFGPGEPATVGSFHNPVLVHFVAGASPLGTLGDGIALVAGTATATADVSVVLFRQDAEGAPVLIQDSVTPEFFENLGGEWSLLLDDGGAGLLEGNYNLDAFFQDDLTSADACLGVP